MELPEDFVQFLSKYNSKKEIIEDLFLASLIDSYGRVKEIDNILTLDETKIRNKFQYDLFYANDLIKNEIQKGFVTFTAENQVITKQEEVKRTDIQFIINGVITYVIECKKLKGVNKTQYINNGISRFINHVYISEDEKYAGMCSFIVGGNLNNIIKGIKEIVSQYRNIQVICEKICGFEPSFISSHQKIDNKPIYLHHLFFNLKSNKNT